MINGRNVFLLRKPVVGAPSSHRGEWVQCWPPLIVPVEVASPLDVASLLDILIIGANV